MKCRRGLTQFRVAIGICPSVPGDSKLLHFVRCSTGAQQAQSDFVLCPVRVHHA